MTEKSDHDAGNDPAQTGAPIPPEVVFEYTRVLADLTNVITNEQLPLLLGVLERVPDPGIDLHAKFESDASDLHSTVTWLDYLRILRFSVNLRAGLAGQYDFFVQAYQQLSAKTELGDDERKLLGEIGDFMYAVDDLAGQYERHSMKLITELSMCLKLTYGILHEPNKKMYAHPVHEDHARRLRPLIAELITLGHQMREQVKVMTALVRMRKLMLKF
ncbi:MAG: hypothetical protein RIF32_21395 [Leptospirales bacterium]|jgi:hypothetical protein